MSRQGLDQPGKLRADEAAAALRILKSASDGQVKEFWFLVQNWNKKTAMAVFSEEGTNWNPNSKLLTSRIKGTEVCCIFLVSVHIWDLIVLS